MTVAIHNSQRGFHPRWVAYCEEQGIAYKRVDCYASNIIEQLTDCDALMWHHSQNNSRDVIIAKQILFALEHTGFAVFPNFKTAWHFDDKLGQKYLFESVKAPLVPSYAFYEKEAAMAWADSTSFPKVFKLRGGAGSANVKLVNTAAEAKRVIRKAFSRGFPNYDAWGSLKERIGKYRERRTNLFDVLKGFIRLVYAPNFSKVLGRERGYVYFQDFIPDNEFDIRIIAIQGRAFALKRFVRKGDFRASGSGDFAYEREAFDERCVRIAFELNEKLDLQIGAYDFVFDEHNNPMVVELSYGYVKEVYYPCGGYWDTDMNWHPGEYNHEAWMVESLLNQ